MISPSVGKKQLDRRETPGNFECVQELLLCRLGEEGQKFGVFWGPSNQQKGVYVYIYISMIYIYIQYYIYAQKIYNFNI